MLSQQKMMNKIIFKKLALIYGALDVLLIIICAYFGALYVLNSQLALICAFLIALASFYGYAKRVNVKARQAKISDFDEYFNEDDEIIATSADSTSAGQDNAQVIKQENVQVAKQESEVAKQENVQVAKQEAKKPKIPFSAYDFLSALAPLRLASYALLVLCFFWLFKNNLFLAIPFLAGLSVMPLGALIAGIFFKA